MIFETSIRAGLNVSVDELAWPLIPLSVHHRCKALSTDLSTGHADFHDSNSKNSHQTLIRNPVLESMNNAAHLEHWPASVHSPVCLILSSLAHISAFILCRLTKQVPPNAHKGVADSHCHLMGINMGTFED